MAPFHKVDLKKQRSLRCRRGIFCNLQGDLKKKKREDHRTANLLLSTLCRSLPKNKVEALCQTLPLHKKKTSFRASQNEKRLIKCSFTLVKNLCKNAGKYFALFCAYKEH